VAQTRETKRAIISAYRAIVEGGMCINRSKESLEDCLEYVFATDGCPIHSKAQDKTDPSGAKSNHGDRTMADALAWKLIGGNTAKPKEPEKPKAPYGSLAWRNQQREEAKRKKDNDGW
jgi:hypothetical protein